MRINIPIRMTIVATLVALAVVICFVPLKQVAYAVTVDYEDTETYYEDEPYDATDTYIETVPLSYVVTDSYVYEDTYTRHWTANIGGLTGEGTEEVPIQVAAVRIENTDDTAGIFTISFSGFTPLFFSSTELNLSPGEDKTASCPSEYNIHDWNYYVTPDTKEVEKERIVTKYREVEKQRTVTKQRQETRYKKVTLLDYLLHYR